MLEVRSAFDNIRDFFITGTAVAAWVFALYKYKTNREGEHGVQIEVTPHIRQTGSVSLIHIAIQIKNTGKAAAFVNAEKVKEAICKIRMVEPTDQVGSSAIPWESTKDLIPPVNYFADWQEWYPDEPFIFEPNMVETYHVAFSTDYHGLVWIRAELVDQEDYKLRGECFLSLPEAANLVRAASRA